MFKHDKKKKPEYEIVYKPLQLPREKLKCFGFLKTLWNAEAYNVMLLQSLFIIGR
jgi:hypothetical protein